MKKLTAVLVATVLLTGFLFSAAQPADAGIFVSAEDKRARLDLAARHTLEKLLAGDAKAQRLYDRAYGYAVFNVTKGALIITGGGGSGVAVHKLTDKRTYMHMGMGGVGLGLGGQAFRMVVLFEDENTFQDFVGSGWHASSSANAVAGRNGANAEASFTNGLAIYHLTDAGLLLQADIAGTRYWRSKRLNVGPADESVRTAATESSEYVSSEYASSEYGSSEYESSTYAPAIEYEHGTETTVYPLAEYVTEYGTEYESQ